MPNSDRRRPLLLLRDGAGLVGLVVFGQVSYVLLTKLLAKDPFTAYKDETSALDPRLALEIRDVSVRHYKGPKLVTNARADRLGLVQDQQTFELWKMHDGVFRTKEKTYRFDANHATYVASTKALNVLERAHIACDDFDVTAPDMLLAGNTKIIDVYHGLEGRLKKGTIRAKDFHYDIDKEMYSATAVHYDGPLDLVEQGDDRAQRTRWDIDGDLKTSPKDKDVMIYTDARATDGEVIIRSPHVEWNRKTDVLVATGGVKYFSGKANLLADKVVVYRKEKRADLTGKVQMLVKPKKDGDNPPKEEEIPPFTPEVPDNVKAGRPAAKPDLDTEKKKDEQIRSSKNIRDFPLAISSERIEYWYGKGKRKAIITGAPQALQQLPEDAWRRVWAYRAVYDGEAETLLLESKGDERETRMKNSIGDDAVAVSITVSTKEDDDTMDAKKMKGVFMTLDDDDDPREKKDKKKPTPGSPPTPPPISGPIGNGKKQP